MGPALGSDQVAQGFVESSLENSPRTTSSLGNLPQCFLILIGV